MATKPDFQLAYAFDGSRLGYSPIVSGFAMQAIYGRTGPAFPFTLLETAGVYDPAKHFAVINPRSYQSGVSDVALQSKFVRTSGSPDFSGLKGWTVKRWIQGLEKGDIDHYVLIDPNGQVAAYTASFKPRFSAVSDVIIPAMKVFGTMAGLIQGAVASASVQTAASGVDMFGFDSFESFDFSSGESFAQFSDASSVDFGFNDMTADFGMIDVPSWQFEPTSFFDAAPQVQNAVAESPVSWFGNVDYGFPEVSDLFQTAKDSIQLAGEAAKTVYSVKNLFGNTAGSASKTYAPAQAKPSTSSLTSNRALALQSENAQQRDFVGQLIGMQNPDGSVNWGSIAMLAGLGIVVYAAVKG